MGKAKSQFSWKVIKIDKLFTSLAEENKNKIQANRIKTESEEFMIDISETKPLIQDGYK
jgi:hypothetical protein